MIKYISKETPNQKNYRLSINTGLIFGLIFWGIVIYLIVK